MSSQIGRSGSKVLQVLMPLKLFCEKSLLNRLIFDIFYVNFGFDLTLPQHGWFEIIFVQSQNDVLLSSNVKSDQLIQEAQLYLKQIHKDSKPVLNKLLFIKVLYKHSESKSHLILILFLSPLCARHVLKISSNNYLVSLEIIDIFCGKFLSYIYEQGHSLTTLTMTRGGELVKGKPKMQTFLSTQGGGWSKKKPKYYQRS